MGCNAVKKARADTGSDFASNKLKAAASCEIECVAAAAALLGGGCECCPRLGRVVVDSEHKTVHRQTACIRALKRPQEPLRLFFI